MKTEHKIQVFLWAFLCGLSMMLFLQLTVFADEIEFAPDDASVFEVTEYIHPEETYSDDYWTDDYTLDFTPEDWITAYEEYAPLAEQVLNDYVGDRSLLTWDSYDELDGIMAEMIYDLDN